MSRLSSDIAWMRDQLLAYGKQSVVIQTNNDDPPETHTLDAVVSQPARDSTTEQGSTVAGNIVDFIFDADAIENGPGRPIVGWLIAVGPANYRVRRGPDNEFYRYTDVNRTMIRIHAVQVNA